MTSKNGSSKKVQGVINNGITGKQRTILKKKISEERKNNNNTSKKPNKVSPSLCEEMTNKYENEDVTYKEIAQSLHIHMSTVCRHINNECEHERNLHITQNECNFMRSQAETGKRVREIARNFRKHGDSIYTSDSGLNYVKITEEGMANKVSYHIRGKCSHDDEIKPLSRSEIRINCLNENGIKDERMSKRAAVFEDI